ncbi:hypothetical protein [Streptomyces violaceusniger]|uniref:hypothetical protein n=1 Tax=Streptomyces violaceusniger TaxID=68280 RepID=UPI0038164E56
MQEHRLGGGADVEVAGQVGGHRRGQVLAVEQVAELLARLRRDGVGRSAGEQPGHQVDVLEAQDRARLSGLFGSARADAGVPTAQGHPECPLGVPGPGTSEVKVVERLAQSDVVGAGCLPQPVVEYDTVTGETAEAVRLVRLQDQRQTVGLGQLQDDVPAVGLRRRRGIVE